MKLYLNTELEAREMLDLLNLYAEYSSKDSDYLKMSLLNSRKKIQEFINRLEDETCVYFYDFASLKLTLSEFGLLYHALSDKNIQFDFLKEVDSFKESLIHILNIDRQVLSRRISDAMEFARAEGKVIGRPQVEENRINKIVYLYTHKKMSMRGIAKECEVSLGTVHKYVNELKSQIGGINK